MRRLLALVALALCLLAMAPTAAPAPIASRRSAAAVAPTVTLVRRAAPIWTTPTTAAPSTTTNPTTTSTTQGWSVMSPTGGSPIPTTTSLTRASLVALITTTSSSVASTPTDATSVDTPDWECIGFHESGNNYRAGGDEPYGGRFQFSVSTWQGLGFKGLPNQAPPATQDRAALALYAYDLAHWGNPWEAWQTAPLCGL